MDKQQFLKKLNSYRKVRNDKLDEYDKLTQFGMTATFAHLNEKEARLAAKYLRRWPHMYYGSYLKWMFGVSPIERIDKNNAEIRQVIWEYHKYFFHQYVGPFFYIDNKIQGLRIDLTEGNIRQDFIDCPISHFDYFYFINSGGDYGHYPRGRVIYHHKTNEFYLYIDESLIKNKDVIEQVMTRYHLSSSNTLIKTDEHYNHDSL